MHTVLRKKWFDRVNTTCPIWDRKSPTELMVSFSGYKPEAYYVAQEVLGALGGVFMTADYDKVSGRTYCIVREPKRLEADQ